ncbi:MAG: phosphoribosylamine--glycine ligase [Acidimicrobiales bacterium]
MRVCLVGSGAREHALAVCLARSAEVVATPGNPGIDGVSASGHLISSVAAPPEEIDADLFVIGPEAPLVAGLADRLRAQGKLVFGPGADGAALEGSKHFLKRLVTDAGVPTARWASFTSGEIHQACEFLAQLDGGYVVKTDGLAAGKGVVVTDDLAEAEADIQAKLSGAAFGDAGRRVVIEEKMEGAELSLFAICDGRRVVALSPAQDYKRLGAGDTGANTGGMGSYSPVPGVGAETIDAILERIVEPTLGALAREGIDYRGLLYAGVMLTSDGPMLVEFNVRFGDPETEVVLPRMESDLTELLAAAAQGDLRRAAEPLPRFSAGAAVCVVAAAAGYPTAPRSGDLITGLPSAGTLTDVLVFHAGTAVDSAGNLRTAGGRVLCVSALGTDLPAARTRAYEAMSAIHFDGMQVRSDIAAARVLTPRWEGTAP